MHDGKGSTAESNQPGAGIRLGLSSGEVIQEFGYDDDVDFDLRDVIEDATGQELVDEDYGDVCDGAIIWWRDGDGDLTDMLVDSLNMLEDNSVIWVLTPKAGRPDYVDPGDIAEAATIAGLHATSSVAAAPNWSGTRLMQRGAKSDKK